MRKAPVPLITSFRLDAEMYKSLNDLASKQRTHPGKLIRRAVQDLLSREMLAEALSRLKAAA